MTTDISKIETNKVKNFTSGESLELKSLWSDQSAVIIFFRRWGCMFCRVWAKEMMRGMQEMVLNVSVPTALVFIFSWIASFVLMTPGV